MMRSNREVRSAWKARHCVWEVGEKMEGGKGEGGEWRAGVGVVKRPATEREREKAKKGEGGNGERRGVEGGVEGKKREWERWALDMPPMPSPSL